MHHLVMICKEYCNIETGLFVGVLQARQDNEPVLHHGEEANPQRGGRRGTRRARQEGEDQGQEGQEPGWYPACASWLNSLSPGKFQKVLIPDEYLLDKMS